MVFAYWELAANFLLGIAWPIVVGLLGWRFGQPLLQLITNLGDRAQTIPTPWGDLTFGEALKETEKLKSVDDDFASNVSDNDKEISFERKSLRLFKNDYTEFSKRYQNGDAIRFSYALLEGDLNDRMIGGDFENLNSHRVRELKLGLRSNAAVIARGLFGLGLIGSHLRMLIEALTDMRNGIAHSTEDVSRVDADRYVEDVEYCLNALSLLDFGQKAE